MKIKKIAAAIAAAAVAVSAMAINAFAIKDYPDGYTLDLIAEGYTVTDVYGFTFHISGDIDSGTGGGVGFNSASTGWESHEWGNADAGKELNGSGGLVTLQKDAPVFKESDVTDPSNPYAQVWMQQWWGTDVTIDSVDILGKDGVVLTPAAPAPEETTAAPEETTAAEEETTTAAEEEADAPADDEEEVAADGEDDVDAAVPEETTAAVTEEVVTTAAETAAAADTTTTPAATGNVAVASVAAVMVIAGTVAIASKKRK